MNQHHSPENTETRSSKKITEQVPLDYKTWASTRFCIPDDGRFRFPFSRTGLQYLYQTGREAEAEKITQIMDELFNNEAKKGNNELLFTCKDYYEGIDGQTRSESIRFSATDGLEKDDPVLFSEVKSEHKSKFQRFMYVSQSILSHESRLTSIKASFRTGFYRERISSVHLEIRIWRRSSQNLRYTDSSEIHHGPRREH
jgi:hypothetical protein